MTGHLLFKNEESEPFYGPLTKEELNFGLIQPIRPYNTEAELKVMGLLEGSLGKITSVDNDGMIPFTKFLNTKGKFNSINNLFIKNAVLKEGYKENIYELYNIIFNTSNFQKGKTERGNKNIENLSIKEMIQCLLIHTNGSNYALLNPLLNQNYIAHKVIIKCLLQLPKEKNY